VKKTRTVIAAMRVTFLFMVVYFYEETKIRKESKTAEGLKILSIEPVEIPHWRKPYFLTCAHVSGPDTTRNYYSKFQ
jgi:hypothetical protein